MKIGIDLGGSHISLGLIKTDGKMIYKTEQDLNGEDIAGLMISLINKLLTENNINIYVQSSMISCPIEKIGVCVPGTISKGVIVKAGNLGLTNYHLQEKLEKEFPMIPIQIRNDAKCAALAEKKFGSLIEYDDCLFINIGTGIGGAAFIKGKLLEPKKYTGFEFGHMVINKEGKECTCGKKGCFEAYCSMKTLKQTLIESLNISQNTTGKELREIIMREIESHTNTKIEEILDEYIENLSIGIGNLIDIFEPEIICFGGSFAYYESIFLNKLKETLDKDKTFNKGNLPKLVMASLQNDAGMLGTFVDA